MSDDDEPRGARYVRYLWLAYLGSLVFQPAFDPDAGPLDWVLVGVLVALFLPLYLAVTRPRSDRAVLVLAGAMALLGLVGSLVNSGASVFVIYAAAAVAYLEPVRRALTAIGGLLGVLLLMLVVSPAPMPWRFLALAPAFVFTVVVGAVNVVDAERGRTRRRLRRADAEIERLAALAERERIGRDLHDLLGHTLSVVVVKVELAGRLVPLDAERAAAEVHDIEQIAREALGEVRTAVAGYRAGGLDAELARAHRALTAAGVDVDVDVELPALPAAHESVLALAVRECVTNVVRHAAATAARIDGALDGGTAVLEVTDDGRGADGPEGAGLTGMRERVSALGGAVDVTVADGTRVRVELPLAASPPVPRTPTGPAAAVEP
ncbi:sensor histidine kinase [Aquipuribacter nitratireducens]|uniref:Sensor histidine kinase n=1 Tax=Aquipuribacter nitratireducens TaxID=650104 RepID=A0ABW0GSW9_9MICO